MTRPKPLYTRENCTAAYQLNWTLSLFAREPLPPTCQWGSSLSHATEPDGVRVLEQGLTKPELVQFFLSSKPDVAPSQIIRSVKGRLQYLLRDRWPRAFRRNYRIESVGAANSKSLAKYIAGQPKHHPMADPRVQKRFDVLQFHDPQVDLERVRYSSHGQFIYNLQVVIENAEGWHELNPENRVKPCDLRPLPLQHGNMYRGVDCDEVGVMSPARYAAFAAERIAGAVASAWRGRQPGAVGFGLGHAVVGRNRLITRHNGRSSMYGDTSHPEFSHVEGYEDRSVNVLFTWNPERELTGAVVNLACPAQAAGGYQISSDFWHETRIELQRRLGDDVFVLPQLSAAGDQAPNILLDRAAEARMRKLTGRTHRQEIGVRIADAVAKVLPFAEEEMDWNPPLTLRIEKVELTRRPITESELKQASADAERFHKSYEKLRREIDENPEKRESRRWYTDITRTYANFARNRRVEVRYADIQKRPKLPIEVHVVRLGDVAFATNPFELYVDFGMQLKCRSKAVQTFIVQHTGCGTYLPTARSLAHGGYGTSPQGAAIAPEGGRELVEQTLELIESLWVEE